MCSSTCVMPLSSDPSWREPTPKNTAAYAWVSEARGHKTTRSPFDSWWLSTAWARGRLSTPAAPERRRRMHVGVDRGGPDCKSARCGGRRSRGRLLGRLRPHPHAAFERLAVGRRGERVAALALGEWPVEPERGVNLREPPALEDGADAFLETRIVRGPAAFLRLVG